MYRQQDEERRSREQNNDANEDERMSDEDDLDEVQSLQAYLFLAFLPTILMYIGLRLTANTEFYQNNHNIMQLFGMILCYINLFLASVIIFLDVLQWTKIMNKRLPNQIFSFIEVSLSKQRPDYDTAGMSPGY